MWLYDGANTGHVAAGGGFADAVTLGNTVAARVVSHRGGDCADARGITPRTQKHINRFSSR
ncbi:hypothetical protein FS593_14270 [Lelliottia amnigena]|nr:hypothetical protein FS593_14270 [Lelliottia amnigena]